MEFPFSTLPTDRDFVLLASVERSINILAVTGKVNMKSYMNLQVLTESLNYAIYRYEFGDESYKNVIKVLKNKITKLQNECKDICSYSELPLKEKFCNISVE